MADHESRNEHKSSVKKSKSKRKLKTIEADEDEREKPSKSSRLDEIEEFTAEPEPMEATEAEILEDGYPWRNLQLILSLQNKNLDIEKKIELAYGYVKLGFRDVSDDKSPEPELVSIPRVILFLSNWVQSTLILSEKQDRVMGSKPRLCTGGSCLDYRCWGIFKFCLEEGLKLHVSLNFSRDILRVFHYIARDAMSQLTEVARDWDDEQLRFYNIICDCISYVFSSHGGVSNENIDLWVSMVDTTLKLALEVLTNKIHGNRVNTMIVHLTCLLLEPFTRFLRVHPTRKNGFNDFVDHLLDPCLRLLEVLPECIHGSNPGLENSLLKLVEEVLSQGLFHQSHIDGFLGLQSLIKYKSSEDARLASKTVIRSYHRHLFDKLEKIVVEKNALALGGQGKLFRLYVHCVSKQESVQVKGVLAQSDYHITGSMLKMPSGSSNIVSEKTHSLSALSAQTQKSLFDFFVQIMEPLLQEIDKYLEAELEVGPLLLEVHATLKSVSSILFSLMHENVYVRAEDISEGACLNFLRVAYNKISLFSAKINQLLPSTLSLDTGAVIEVVKIAKELLVSIRYLVDIEYEVVGNDLESLWILMFSYGPLLYSLADLPDQSLICEVVQLGCYLVNLYGELRQVNTSVFALCKALRRLLLSISDVELSYSKYMTCTSSSYCESWVNSLSTILCSPEFRHSICNAIKSIPEGQVSGCIRELTTDISESLEWIKDSCAVSIENDLALPDLDASLFLNIRLEFFGRGLSEVYSLILESLTVTNGNSSLAGASLNGLVEVMRPSMSILVSQPTDGIYEFLSIVSGRAFNKEIGRGNKMLSAHWFLLFFFRLFMSCRSLCHQIISLAPPDASKRMSNSMHDPFTAYSGNDWLERNGLVEEGYFSWIVQPSASLVVITEAISDICFLDTANGCSPLIYILNAMALQRLVDLNRLIMSFKFLLERNDSLIAIQLANYAGQLDFHKQNKRWKKCLSAFRQEAEGLTSFMMGYLPSKGQLVSSSSQDAWDFAVGSMNNKSLPSALWYIICRNIDIWSTHAATKQLKTFLSFLIRNSLCSSMVVSDFEKQSTNRLGNSKTTTMRDVSFELLRDTILYEQGFIRRHIASRFCGVLAELVPLMFGNDGQVDLKSPSNWEDVLNSFESSSVISKNENVVSNHSSGRKRISQISGTFMRCCNEQGMSSTSVEYTACQNLLNYLCWMPKGCLSSKSSSLYATCILNLERLVVGTLLGHYGSHHSVNRYELFKLFLFCRRTLKHLMVAFCDETSQQSLASCFGGTFPATWLLKSLLMVSELQVADFRGGPTSMEDLTFSLMDNTSYVFLTFSKLEFTNAFRFHISSEENCDQKPEPTVNQEQESDLTKLNAYVNSLEDTDAWEIIVQVIETLKDQMESFLILVKKSVCTGGVEGSPDVINFKKLLSITACFQGLLWGLTSSLDYIDGESSILKAIFSRTNFEPTIKVNHCIDTFVKCVSYFLCELFVEDGELSESLLASRAFLRTGCNGDFLGLKGSSCILSGEASDILYNKRPNDSHNPRNISESSVGKDGDASEVVSKKKSRLENAVVDSILTEIDSRKSLKLSFLQKLLAGENLEEAFFLRQLFVSCSAILRLNFLINSTSFLSSLVPVLMGISHVLFPEFANDVQAPSTFTFVWLDGVAKFLEELGNYFPLTNPILSRNVYSMLIDLHLKAIGKSISLQGKGATLASHETESSTKTLAGQLGLSKHTQSNRSANLDDFKSRLRMSFKVFVRKPLELHLLSAIQSIERALVGVQEGIVANYQLQTGSLDGGKVSSVVAAGIECFDLILESIAGRNRLSLVKRHIRSLVSCLFNIIIHLQGPKVFYAHRIPDTVCAQLDPDPGSVVLMSIEILTKVSGRHALYQMDACHVADALRVPGALFQNILHLGSPEPPAQYPLLKSSSDDSNDSVENMNALIVDRQFSVDLYAACCRMLCAVLRHHKRESNQCIALLEDSVRVLLCCLEMIDFDLAVQKTHFAWEVQEGVKCACFLRRIYEEIRQQKDVLGRHCSHFLSNYIRIYSGYGPLKAGIRREIDEALRPGVYALIDACSADDMQYIHTVLGEGPCRSTLANLQHDYKLNFQYEGKV